MGKIPEPGDDWHFDIQHVGAQTRFLREHVNEYNLITVYLETTQKSWPAWKAKYPDHAKIIKTLVEYLKSLFSNYDPFIILTGHSGGGRFTFSFLDAFDTIPNYVKRISFLDSNYGYEDNYGKQITDWLNASNEHYLHVIAYNDSIALYNGKTFVSPTGGTWYRSRIMKNYLSKYFAFTDEEDNEFIKHTALNRRIIFILKKNPFKQVLHTIQVERNGFIQGMVSGTSNEDESFTYYGTRAYSKWIQINIKHLNYLSIPPRSANAKTGSEFMRSVNDISFEKREKEIFKEILTGNIPNFLRDLIAIEGTFKDTNGIPHVIKYQVMSDYLSIGADSDFCRIPMDPITAQKIANLFTAILPTRKLVDNVYQNCKVKLEPYHFKPIGNQNELASKFVEHNKIIESQRDSVGGKLGELIGGIKKDVIISNKIIDPARPNHVVIYGWHKLNGEPIQPLTNIHVDWYVDYSHGIRLLNSELWIDDKIMKIQDVLKDPVLYKILSDEEGAMIQPEYILNSN